MVATNEGNSYRLLLDRPPDKWPDVLLLNSPTDLPAAQGVRGHVGNPQLVCGGALAYIPDWDSSETREAAAMYLRYLGEHC